MRALASFCVVAGEVEGPPAHSAHGGGIPAAFHGPTLTQASERFECDACLTPKRERLNEMSVQGDTQHAANTSGESERVSSPCACRLFSAVADSDELGPACPEPCNVQQCFAYSEPSDKPRPQAWA